jgi:hypothetical protein
MWPTRARQPDEPEEIPRSAGPAVLTPTDAGRSRADSPPPGERPRARPSPTAGGGDRRRGRSAHDHCAIPCQPPTSPRPHGSRRRRARACRLSARGRERRLRERAAARASAPRRAACADSSGHAPVARADDRPSPTYLSSGLARPRHTHLVRLDYQPLGNITFSLRTN